MEEPPQANVPLPRAVELMTTWKDSNDAESIIELVSDDLW
jgi:hypothetical protein